MSFSLEMRPVYGDNYFTRLAIDVWCKKFAHGRDGVVNEERPGEMFRRSMQRSQQLILPCGETGMWRRKCLNEFGRYVGKNETIMLTFKQVQWLTVTLFSFLVTRNALKHLQVVRENCWAKYCNDCLCSKYNWRHSDDVIVTKISVYIPQ